MTQKNECRKLHSSVNMAARGLAVAIMALTAAFLFPSAQAKDIPYNPDNFTRVYEFNYDEVFQAAQQAMLRRGLNVKEADKDKGIIRIGFADLHIEQISPKPEVRVTIDVHLDPKKKYKPGPNYVGLYNANILFGELAKVLATYQ